MFVLGLLAGKSATYIGAEIKDKWTTTFLTSCCVFPFANFINHLYVPFHYKILYQTCISFLWNNFLCFVKEKPVSVSDNEEATQPEPTTQRSLRKVPK